MSAILALDQGTTGSTALMVARDLTVVGKAYREFPQKYPKSGWVEHDPQDIFTSTVDAAREAVERAGSLPVAIGITNQRETVLVWERDSGDPLYSAIVWQDRRTTGRCDELRQRYGTHFLKQRTGLVWDPYFSATKMEWLLENVPGLRRRVDAGEAVFGTVDTWLVYKLTGGASFVTDHTNASRTMLYNLDSGDWDDDLLEIFRIPRSSLPKITFSSERVGTTAAQYFGSEIPITGVAGDQQAALYGHVCWESGSAKCTFGTGAFLLSNLGNERVPVNDAPVLATIACDSTGKPVYALEGSVFVAGAAVKWLRDGMELVEHASQTADLAASVEDNGGVFVVPAFVGLGAPYWEPRARGTIVGLTLGTTRAHLVRAVLESMAYSTKDVATAMGRVSKLPLGELRTAGGVAANDWLMQYQADVLGVPVGRPVQVETTALGAAGLAGRAVGFWDTPDDYARSREYQWFKPGASRDREYDSWRRAVAAALHWAESEGSGGGNGNS